MSNTSFWEGTDAEIISNPQMDKKSITPSIQEGIGRNTTSLEVKANPSNFWEGTDAEIITDTPQDQQPQYSIGNRVASATKAAVAGAAGGIPDTAALAYNLPVMGINKLRDIAYPDRKKDFPLIPSATEAIDRGIDSATGGYTDTPEDQKHINEALKFGASMPVGGFIGRSGNKVVSTVGKFTGSTDKAQIAGATAAGGTMSYLHDQGATTGETLGGGVAANLATTLITKKAPSAVGLGKSSLDLKLAKASKDLDIPLPNSMISKSKVIKVADNYLDKIPYIGKNAEKRQAVIGERVLKELDNAYDSVINAKELAGVEDRISRLYKSGDQLLPENAIIVPQRTIKAIDDIKSNIKTLAPSTDEKKLLSEIDNITNSLNPDNSIHVGYLTGTKRSFNSTIKWDIQDGNVKDLLKNVQHALKEDMAEYGKKNPEWHKFFTKADELYGKVAKREKLEDLLTGKAISDVTGELSYNNLSKVLHNKKTSAQLQRLVEPEIFDRLKKLGTVARAITIKDKALQKQSGKFAIVQSAAKIIGGITGISGAGVLAPTATTMAVIATLPIAHLISDRRTLDLAINFAENTTPANAVKFSQRMKAITGYTPVTLLKEAQKLEQENQEESGDSMGQKINRHIEENKAKPKAPAFNKTIEDMYNNQYIKNFIEAN